MPIVSATSRFHGPRTWLPALWGLLALGIISGCAPIQAPLESTNGKSERVVLSRERKLTILLPPGYVVSTEVSAEGGGSLTLHHVWRSPAPPLEKEASLGISLSPFRLPYCPAAPADDATVAPTLTVGWQSRWRACETSQPGVHARESFPALPGGTVLHLFIVGSGRAEFDPLQRIAESLRWR